jgi:hypothetical protein
LNYNRRVHPAFKWGYFTVFVCLVIMTIAAMTNIVPLTWQPRFITLLVAAMLVSGVFAIAGFFKSNDRNAYPVLAAFLFIPVILAVILFLVTR